MRARQVTDVRADRDDTAELVTQLLPGEPVVVVDRSGDWVEVHAPWQPSSKAPDGYPGWVRAADLADEGGTDAEPVQGDLLTLARRYVGTRYVWGGMTQDGIDCSGLVHRPARELGIRLPRDARDQAAALTPVPLDEVAVGDLYFFAKPGRAVHHVAIVTAPLSPDGARPMLHASYDDGLVVEEPMPPQRLADLVSAARVG